MCDAGWQQTTEFETLQSLAAEAQQLPCNAHTLLLRRLYLLQGLTGFVQLLVLSVVLTSRSAVRRAWLQLTGMVLMVLSATHRLSSHDDVLFGESFVFTFMMVNACVCCVGTVVVFFSKYLNSVLKLGQGLMVVPPAELRIMRTQLRMSKAITPLSFVGMNLVLIGLPYPSLRPLLNRALAGFLAFQNIAIFFSCYISLNAMQRGLTLMLFLESQSKSQRASEPPSQMQVKMQRHLRTIRKVKYVATALSASFACIFIASIASPFLLSQWRVCMPSFLSLCAINFSCTSIGLAWAKNTYSLSSIPIVLPNISPNALHPWAHHSPNQHGPSSSQNHDADADADAEADASEVALHTS